MRSEQEYGKWKLTNTYCKLPGRFYTKPGPAYFPAPELLLFNEELAESLGIRFVMSGFTDHQKALIFSGNLILEGTEPLAQAYCGHQFGYFNLLGDGRAKLLGEWIGSDHIRYDIQLKGSGITMYSRGGDGKAVLSPMLREYMISEAMNGLGIPTTRSLAVVLTGETVLRDGLKKGAVLTRVAKSHLRVGTFQFARLGMKSDIEALADYAIDRHYPELNNILKKGENNRYIQFFKKITEIQAKLIAKWQLSGFIHGVMNTDNMSISGETIDYGPCAFMDTYDPSVVFSSIDANGRYRYENQPKIGKWNLARLAEALLPIADRNQERALEQLNETLSEFDGIYEEQWFIGMKEKLGLNPKKDTDSSDQRICIFCETEREDKKLIDTLLRLMKAKKADYTNTFAGLTMIAGNIDAGYLSGTEGMFKDLEFLNWIKQWKERRSMISNNEEQEYEGMKNINPFVIPRNHLVEEVLAEFEKGNKEPYLEFLQVLNRPYDYSENLQKYQELPLHPDPDYRTYCGT